MNGSLKQNYCIILNFYKVAGRWSYYSDQRSAYSLFITCYFHYFA